MSLFQCEHCGCCENTALAMQGFKGIEDWFDWSGIEERKGKLLCSACGPSRERNGAELPYGKWHGKFDRVFLPIGKFKTDKNGNLEHIETGSTDFRQYAL